MKEEKLKLADKILAELESQFPGSNPAIVELSERSFKYQLERNDNYQYYLTGYSIDLSGNLIIDWKSSEQFML